MGQKDNISIVSELVSAREHGRMIEPGILDEGQYEQSDAESIQDGVAEYRQEEVVGWKVGGFFSRSRGLVRPFYGRVFSSETFECGSAIELNQSVGAFVEVEVAVQISDTLNNVDLDLEDFSNNYISAARVALELVVPVFEDLSRLSGLDIVCDNGCCGGMVLGDVLSVDQLRDEFECNLKCYLNSDLVINKSVSLGIDKFAAPALWLAKHLLNRGVVISPGSWILTGTLMGMVEIKPGDSFHADLENLGGVKFERGA